MKKIVVLFLLVLSFIFINFDSVSAAYIPKEGDLIKTANNPAVYLIGMDYRRHLFVNSVTFWSWHNGTWKDNPVNIITQADLDNILIGENIRSRAGSLIRFENSNLIYAVLPENKLCQVIDGSIFGYNWKIRVLTIQAGFANDYKNDLSCVINKGDKLPDGFLFKYLDSNDVYYIENGTKRLVLESGFRANNFKESSIIQNVATTTAYITVDNLLAEKDDNISNMASDLVLTQAGQVISFNAEDTGIVNGKRSAQINWWGSIGGVGQYRLSDSNGNSSASWVNGSSAVFDGSGYKSQANLYDLSPNTLYYYQVRFYDIKNKQVTPAINQTFKTSENYVVSKNCIDLDLSSFSGVEDGYNIFEKGGVVFNDSGVSTRLEEVCYDDYAVNEYKCNTNGEIIGGLPYYFATHFCTGSNMVCKSGACVTPNSDEYGTIIVESNIPGKKVWLNGGNSVGVTPLKIGVVMGYYTVKVEDSSVLNGGRNYLVKKGETKIVNENNYDIFD